MADDLVDHRTIASDTWRHLRRSPREAQIIEAIALIGHHRTITFFCAGLELPLEDHAARFPGAFKLEEGT